MNFGFAWDFPRWLLRAIQDEWPTRNRAWVEPVGYVDEPVRMTRKEFDELGEYSTTIPTGVVLWKRWRRDENACVRGAPAKWCQGMYVPVSTETDDVGIRWQPIEVVG